MKPYYILFLFLIFGLIFVVSKNDPGQPMTAQMQAEEAAPETEKLSSNTFRIRMDIEEKNDQPVADILWFQKAAEFAMAKKVPWFNVLEQKISPYEVEGVIQLERDPMKAEYDANEILSLHLDDETAE